MYKYISIYLYIFLSLSIYIYIYRAAQFATCWATIRNTFVSGPWWESGNESELSSVRLKSPPCRKVVVIVVVVVVFPAQAEGSPAMRANREQQAGAWRRVWTRQWRTSPKRDTGSRLCTWEPPLAWGFCSESTCVCVCVCIYLDVFQLVFLSHATLWRTHPFIRRQWNDKSMNSSSSRHFVPCAYEKPVTSGLTAIIPTKWTSVISYHVFCRRHQSFVYLFIRENINKLPQPSSTTRLLQLSLVCFPFFSPAVETNFSGTIESRVIKWFKVCLCIFIQSMKSNTIQYYSI